MSEIKKKTHSLNCQFTAIKKINASKKLQTGKICLNLINALCNYLISNTMKKLNRLVLFLLLMAGPMLNQSYSQSNNTINSIPSISTLPIIRIGMDTAICGGKIVSDGGQTITASGICISKNPFPTINDRVISSSATSGEFVSQLRSLYPKTAYYVRAFATNASGTAYGVQRTFATDPYAIGQELYGGVFFYELQPGDNGYVPDEFHGLVYVNGKPENVAIIWHNGVDTLTNASDSTIGNGSANTNLIVSVQGVGNYAASKAANFSYNGYSDWYLPNLKEMQLLINVPASPCSSNCWTSNEYSSSQAIGYVAKKQTIALKNKKYKSVFIRRF